MTIKRSCADLEILAQLAKEYMEICDKECCSGDKTAGIPPCKFWNPPDVGMFGEPLPCGCELQSMLENPKDEAHEIEIELREDEVFEAYSQKDREYIREDVCLRLSENEGDTMLRGYTAEEVSKNENLLEAICERVERVGVDDAYWNGIDSCIEYVLELKQGESK